MEPCSMLSGERQAQELARLAQLQARTLDDRERDQIRHRRSSSHTRRLAAAEEAERRASANGELQAKLAARQRAVATESFATSPASQPSHPSSPQKTEHSARSRLFDELPRARFQVPRAASETRVRPSTAEPRKQNNGDLELWAKLARRREMCEEKTQTRDGNHNDAADSTATPSTSSASPMACTPTAPSSPMAAQVITQATNVSHRPRAPAEPAPEFRRRRAASVTYRQTPARAQQLAKPDAELQAILARRRAACNEDILDSAPKPSSTGRKSGKTSRLGGA